MQKSKSFYENLENISKKSAQNSVVNSLTRGGYVSLTPISESGYCWKNCLNSLCNYKKIQYKQ